MYQSLSGNILASPLSLVGVDFEPAAAARREVSLHHHSSNFSMNQVDFTHFPGSHVAKFTWQSIDGDRGAAIILPEFPK